MFFEIIQQKFAKNLASTANFKLYASWLETPLGRMLAIADDKQLYLLEFDDQSKLISHIERLQTKLKAIIITGKTKVLEQIESELKAYFNGTLQAFTTPLFLLGSLFQKHAWEVLQQIPYGETRSYLEQASNIGNAKAFRAVANANGSNPLAIIIPCHRIINHNGKLGGYGGGLHRKEWLIKHENYNR